MMDTEETAVYIENFLQQLVCSCLRLLYDLSPTLWKTVCPGSRPLIRHDTRARDDNARRVRGAARLSRGFVQLQLNFNSNLITTLICEPAVYGPDTLSDQIFCFIVYLWRQRCRSTLLFATAGKARKYTLLGRRYACRNLSELWLHCLSGRLPLLGEVECEYYPIICQGTHV